MNDYMMSDGMGNFGIFDEKGNLVGEAMGFGTGEYVHTDLNGNVTGFSQRDDSGGLGLFDENGNNTGYGYRDGNNFDVFVDKTPKMPNPVPSIAYSSNSAKKPVPSNTRSNGSFTYIIGMVGIIILGILLLTKGETGMGIVIFLIGFIGLGLMLFVKNAESNANDNQKKS